MCSLDELQDILFFKWNLKFLEPCQILVLNLRFQIPLLKEL
jgi:hypothetical protein